jgi:hypothetical protein
MRADAPELASGPPRLAACVQLLHHRRLAPESYRNDRFRGAACSERCSSGCYGSPTATRPRNASRSRFTSAYRTTPRRPDRTMSLISEDLSIVRMGDDRRTIVRHDRRRPRWYLKALK